MTTMVTSTTGTSAATSRMASGPVGPSFAADLERLRELRSRIAEGADPVFTLDGPRAQVGSIIPTSVAISTVPRPGSSGMAPTLWSMPLPPPPPAPPLGLSGPSRSPGLSAAELALAKARVYAGDPMLEPRGRPNGFHSLPARPVDTMRPSSIGGAPDLPVIPTTDSAEMKRALSDERHQRLAATNNKSDVKPSLAALQIPRDPAAAVVAPPATSAIDSAASRESKHRRSSRGHGRSGTTAARDDDDMDIDGVSLGGGSEAEPSTSSRRHRERDRDRDRERERRREERDREDERERERKRERKAKKERRSRSPEPKRKSRAVDRSPELGRSRRRSASPVSRRRARSPEPSDRRQSSASTRGRSPELPRSPDRPLPKKLESVRPPAPPQPPSPPVEPAPKPKVGKSAPVEAEPSAKTLKERLSRSGTTKPADLAIVKPAAPTPAPQATAVRDLRERIGGRGEPVSTPSSAPAPALLSRLEQSAVPPTPASAPVTSTNGKVPVSAHSVVDPRKVQAAPASAPSLVERLQPNGAAPARRPPSPPRNTARYDRPPAPALPPPASAPTQPNHQRLIDRIQPQQPEHHRPRPPSPPPLRERPGNYPPASYDRPVAHDRFEPNRSYPPARYEPPPPVDTRPRDYYPPPPPPAPVGYDRPPYNEYDRRPVDEYPRSAGYDDRGFGRPPPPPAQSAYPDRYGAYDGYGPPPHSASSSYDRPATPASAYGYPPQPPPQSSDLRALYDRIQPSRQHYAGSIEARPPPPPPQPPYPDDRRRDDRPAYNDAARAYYEQQQRSVGRPADYDPWRGR